MLNKILTYFLLFYFLILFQTSFFVHFKPLNLTLILVIFLNLFQDPKSKDGILAAIFGGFFLDIFSENLIGFHVLILIAIAIFLKLIFRKYVRIPTIKKI